MWLLSSRGKVFDMDKPENEIVDGERSEDDVTPAPEQNMER